MTDPRCSIRRDSIRLKGRIGPITDARRKNKIVIVAQLMGVPVSRAERGQGRG